MKGIAAIAVKTRTANMRLLVFFIPILQNVPVNGTAHTAPGGVRRGFPQLQMGVGMPGGTEHVPSSSERSPPRLRALSLPTRRLSGRLPTHASTVNDNREPGKPHGLAVFIK